MQIAPFETEHFFAKYEFNTPYQLCNSDCESMSIAELLELADVPIEELGRESLAYTESQGHPELRSLIASTYGTVQPEEVVLLNSPVEGIYLNARAALNPGDEVIVLSPAYDALIHMFEHVVDPSHVKKWNFEKTPTGWELDLDTLTSLISPKTKLLVVNFPHNPTGFLPTPDFFKQLAAIVSRQNILVFSDEMYHGLVHEGTPEISSAADLNMAGVTLSGLSKTYGLPGLRTGWLIVKDATLRQQIINWKFYTSICPPGPTEFLAKAALKVHEKLRTSSLERIHHNLDFADAFFQRWSDLFSWQRPRAGSTALVGFRVPSVSALVEDLAQSEGVLIQSAKMLDLDDQHMRMGFDRSTFQVALDRFEQWLDRNRQRLQPDSAQS